MKNLVTIGDSITAGATMVSEGVYTWDHAYPLQLGTLLNKAIVNKGLGGDHFAGMLARFASDVLLYDPEYVIIMAAHNDIGRWGVDVSATNYQAMIDAALDAGAKVIMVTVPPCHYSDPWFAATNAWVNGLDIPDVTVVDTWDALSVEGDILNPDYDSGDGIHLNEAGYAVIAQAVFAGAFASTALITDNVWSASVAGPWSNPDNWSLGHVPTSVERAVFKDTSVVNCSMDTQTLCDGWSTRTGYTGILTQAAGVSPQADSGGIAIGAGTVTGNRDPTKPMRSKGPVTKTGGTITDAYLDLEMLGEGSVISSNTAISFHSLIASANASLIGALTHVVTGGSGKLRTAPKKTLSLGTGTVLIFDYGAPTYENLGDIGGAGTLRVKLYGADRTLDLGDVSCLLDIRAYSNATGNRKLTLGGQPVLGRVQVLSDHPSNTITLDTAGFALTHRGLTVGTRGAVKLQSSKVTSYGNLDTSLGSLDAGTSQYVQAAPGTIKLGAGQSLHDVEAPVVPLDLASDVTITGRYRHLRSAKLNGFTLTFDPAKEVRMLDDLASMAARRSRIIAVAGGP